MAQPPYSSYPGAPVSGDYYPPAVYPPQPSAPGYPPNPAYAAPGYSSQPGAYPPPTSGYPPQPGASSYPPAAGYPPQPGAGYPPQPGAGYPPQPGAGYPPQPGAGYPPQPGAGYPPQPGAGYPPQPGAGYPPQPGYPPQATPSYPPQPTPGYSPQPPAAYPPQPAASYPPQPAAGYGYAPQATATYPGQAAYASQPAYAAPVPSPQFPQAPIVPQSVYPSMATQGASVAGAGAVVSAYAMPRMDAGTVFPAPNFNVETDCETLRHAMKGIGTDEKAIIEVLSHRSNAQRQEILKKYKTMYGKDLIKELRSELTGNFEHTIISLMLTPPEFRAKELRDAMKGAGTDEIGLIQVLCTGSNQMIHDTRDAYKRMFDRNLEKDIEKETSGHFKRLLIACANGSRNETPQVDMNKAQILAEQLYRAGAAKMGTDEAGFLRVLANESYPQLQATFDVYRQRYGKSIEDVLKSEMSGDLLRGMLAIVRCVTNPPGYFAKALYDSMSGAGTRDHELVRIVVMRCEVDMQLIKQEFQRAYGKTLASMIAGDTSGDYKKILVALVGP